MSVGSSFCLIFVFPIIENGEKIHFASRFAETAHRKLFSLAGDRLPIEGTIGPRTIVD